MDHLTQDLRFAVRSFLRAPRFTIPAIVALALGIGATSAVFSVVRGVLLEPLPYEHPDRIVTIWESNVARNRLRNVVGPANFAAWLERNRSFAHLGMVGPARSAASCSTASRSRVAGMSARPRPLPRSASSRRSAAPSARKRTFAATTRWWWSATSSGRPGSVREATCSARP